MIADVHVGDAVLYDTDDELVAVTAPFLRAGLAAGDGALVICSDRRRELIGAAVGDARLRTRPLLDVWRRPIEAMTDLRGLLEDHTRSGRGLRVVADADHGAGPVEWSEWARYEAVAHDVTRGHPVRSLCLLDRREAAPAVVDAGERLHPAVWRGGVRTAGPVPGLADNVRRDGYVRTDPMEAGPPALRVDDLTAAGLAGLRHALLAELDTAGLPPWRAYELVLAVGEVAANAVRHGRPPVTVRLWRTATRVLCTVADHGAGFDYPVSSYLPPDPLRHGLGLYLARQLCDQVNICWTPVAFTVRLALLLP